MFHSINALRLLAAVAIVAFCAAEAAALPTIRPPSPPAPGGAGKPPAGGRKPSNKKKTADPLDAAIKDLKDAEKDLDSKDGSPASRLTRSAEQVVSNQAKLARQARDQAADSGTATKEQKEHIKTRISALDGILKDIRSAEKEITARKADDAKSAIQSAITGLEGLTGAGKKKK
jgi:hypothetical protein